MSKNANNVPLGTFNPTFGGAVRSGGSLLRPDYLSSDNGSSSSSQPRSIEYHHESGVKRSHEGSSTGTVSRSRFDQPPPPGKEESREERRKKRKSRWEAETDKVVIPGMPTMIPAGLSNDQEKIYLLQLQIEEISRKLRTGDLGIPMNPEERSPSPEPIYSNEGKRLNTREFRTRKKLEDDRHSLIQQMAALNPAYKPPSDYKAPQSKISEKVLIPQEEYPDINFVGLLIGPRGNTLKSMEKDTQAKIIIRGKGSVKEGKIGRNDGQPLPGQDEPLHAFVTAATLDQVKRAVARIKEVIRQGIEVPENQNDLRRNQLRELALLNGTLRENDGPRCTNCGSNAHRSWQCPDKPNITNNVTCTTCGGAGHIAKDCKEKKRSGSFSGLPDLGTAQKIDEEYMSLMAELGEAPPQSKSNSYASGGYNSNQTTVLQPRNLEPPKALLPAPPPPPPTSSSSLLPTPSSVQSATGWTDPNAAAYWAAGQTATYPTAYPTPAAAAAYGYPQLWSTTGQNAAAATAANPWAAYMTAPPPPPPPPPPSS